MGKKNMFLGDKGSSLEGFESQSFVKQLEIIDIVEGIGEVIYDGAQLKAHYRGALCKTGIIFESSHDNGKPLMFMTHEVIQGWAEGLQGMRVGGKRRIIIPAAKAYGATPPSKDIPKNADLVFDIELLQIVAR